MANLKDVLVPDIGDFKDIPVIEVLVKPGDKVKAEESLITLESDKATMEVPSPSDGIIKDMRISVGDNVSEGTVILSIETLENEENSQNQPEAKDEKAANPPSVVQDVAPKTSQKIAHESTPTEPVVQSDIDTSPPGSIHASPGVRRLARELGVNLKDVNGSGPKNRIMKEDVQSFVKASMQRGGHANTGGSLGLNVPNLPVIDFSKFGPIETKALTRIKKISGPALHRNWVSIPHITQHDEADITELDIFRKSLAKEADKAQIKVTPLALIMKATVAALKKFPDFNSSLTLDGASLVMKKYFHIGVAVDTPSGLVVPVIRDIDQKGVFEIAQELGQVSTKARDGKLSPGDMSGGTFSISSLGGIGGGYFTPIINAPEVAILGVGRATIKPVWDGTEFTPRLMLPLSLSYDHRVIDGAEGARFITALNSMIADIRRTLI